MMATKPRMLVAIALANKMARALWAMLTKNEDYREGKGLGPTGRGASCPGRPTERLFEARHTRHESRGI